MPFGIDLSRRRYIMLWQLLLIILGTTWLWAPHENHLLSYRTSLISQYETSSEPYSWVFRLGDLAAGLIVTYLAIYILQKTQKRIPGLLLMLIGLGMIADPLFTTTCRQVGNTCQEYFSVSFLLHAIETVLASAAFFAVVAYDAWSRKKLVSILFAAYMVGYGVLFLSQYANQQHFNTIAQYVYQTSLIIWLTWFGRDLLAEKRFQLRKLEARIAKNTAAAWAFINGVIAIQISLAHINLAGKIKGIYFASDNAWLAQHGVIIGVVMLYLSRHLARGEQRARQIFLAIMATETLKYSLITPTPTLMVFYLLTFTALFIFRDDFDRGTVPLTWQIRLRDLYFVVGGLLAATVAALITLDRDNRVSTVASSTFDHFFDYVDGHTLTSHERLKSILLAHTITAFLSAAAVVILWVLFKPSKIGSSAVGDYDRVKIELQNNSSSSEDYFKLWPTDKKYYFGDGLDGFIAYKVVGSVAYGLADPIAANQAKLLNQFLGWTKEHRLKTCFLPVDKSSQEIYKTASMDLMQIGSSALVDIQNFINSTSSDKWWRWKINRGKKAGYTYRMATPPHSSEKIHQLKDVSDAWLQREGREERAFALGYFDDKYLQQCVIHYLVDSNGKIIAFTNQLPLFFNSPVATVDLLRFMPDASDALPYLLYNTIHEISKNQSKYQFFDLGFVPFAKAKGPALAIARVLATGRFSSKGLEQFKNKFDPQWQANYLAYEGDIADLATIALNLEKAMEL